MNALTVRESLLNDLAISRRISRELAMISKSERICTEIEFEFVEAESLDLEAEGVEVLVRIEQN